MTIPSCANRTGPQPVQLPSHFSCRNRQLEKPQLKYVATTPMHGMLPNQVSLSEVHSEATGMCEGCKHTSLCHMMSRAEQNVSNSGFLSCCNLEVLRTLIRPCELTQSRLTMQQTLCDAQNGPRQLIDNREDTFRTRTPLICDPSSSRDARNMIFSP